jgi:hypothetical protein
MRLGDLVPALVVLVCVWVGGTMPRPNPCQSSDGPQFKCWLEQQEELG